MLARRLLGRGAGVAFAPVFVIGDRPINLAAQFAQLLQVHRFQIRVHGIPPVGFAGLFLLGGN